MEQQFAQFISDHQLLTAEDRIILATSGGVDSVVMAHLFHKQGYSFALAHVNYQLRGAASLKDQELVQKLANDLQVPCYLHKVNTLEYAETQGISIQMAARDLRYQWFEELLEDSDFSLVATAHHKNDVVETMLLNLTKGTGIRGLHGIPAKRHPFIRPLLFTTKEQLIDYAKIQNIDWREDASNQEDYYQRNLIRNQVIPLLRGLNPNLETAFNNTAEILRDIEDLLKNQIAQIRTELQTQDDSQIRFDKVALSAYPSTVWYELLHPFGFNLDQIQAIRKGLSAQSGQIFYASEFQLVVDRAQLIISPRDQYQEQDFFIKDPAPKEWQERRTQWSMNTVDRAAFELPQSKQVGAWDLDRLKFPLKVRHWQFGDWFHPLGMSHKKKLSDFFIDEKVPLTDKPQIQVVTSGTDIIWVVGYRIDDRFKVHPDTKKILEIKVDPAG